MTFYISKNEIEITNVSNQSTGYCSHIDSWKLVKKSLDKVGLEHPDEFTNPITFGF